MSQASGPSAGASRGPTGRPAGAGGAIDAPTAAATHRPAADGGAVRESRGGSAARQVQEHRREWLPPGRLLGQRALRHNRVLRGDQRAEHFQKSDDRATGPPGETEFGKE